MLTAMYGSFFFICFIIFYLLILNSCLALMVPSTTFNSLMPSSTVSVTPPRISMLLLQWPPLSPNPSLTQPVLKARISSLPLWAMCSHRVVVLLPVIPSIKYIYLILKMSKRNTVSIHLVKI